VESPRAEADPVPRRQQEWFASIRGIDSPGVSLGLLFYPFQHLRAGMRSTRSRISD